MSIFPDSTVSTEQIGEGVFARFATSEGWIGLSYARKGAVPSLLKIMGRDHNPEYAEVPHGPRIEFPNAYIWYNSQSLSVKHRAGLNLHSALILDADGAAISLTFNDEHQRVYIGSGLRNRLDVFYFWTHEWKIIESRNGNHVTIFDNLAAPT